MKRWGIFDGQSRFSRIVIGFCSLIMALVFGFISFGLIYYFIWIVSFRYRSSSLGIFSFISNPGDNRGWTWLAYILMGCALVWALWAWIDALREDARSRRRIEELEEEERKRR